MQRNIITFHSGNSHIDEITIRDEGLFLRDNCDEYEEIPSPESCIFFELPQFENISNRREREFLR